MNIFQSSSVGFRQGRSLVDETPAPSVMRYPILAPAPGDSDTQTSLSYGIGASAAAKQSTDLPALLAAAQQTRPIAAKSGQSTFPSVPYYGILSRCEVRMDVSVERSARAPGWPISDAAGASAGMLLRNPTTTMARMAHIQRRLYDVAERFGSVYHLSNGATLSESVTAPLLPNHGSASSAASFHSQLTYGAYVQALHDAFRRFSALRQACVTMEKAASGARAATIGDDMVTHHTFYVRLLGHPSWKDLSALLCVEKGGLLVCLISSSRITQKHLTAACADAGVSLDWLGGAALVAEPLQLIPGDVNPVWVVWDALVNLPLLPPSSINREGNKEGLTSGADDAADTLDSVSAGAREVLNRVTQTGSTLSGFHISLISSMPFQGSTRFHQVGRIADEAPSSSASALSLSCCAVLPFFMSKLLQCLVEECGLIAFAVHCGGPAELTTHLGAPSVSTGSTASGAVGVRLVHSNAPSLLTLQQGPSSSSCLAFSRLSGAFWVDAETRESLSLGGLTAAFGEPDKDVMGDEEEDTEMEFEVVSIRYERRGELKTMEKEPNKVSVCATAAVESSGSCPWGPSFAFTVSVKRLIAVDDIDA
ncbi:hypothetical protein CGC20_37940 [Leishmania donovani]|uniref:Uncharacterized protein n=1 Tax=Leishmania donovani TaxID=5661 RepID=A0A504Y2M7_LEIDO|nr:hypothetical protein CGC20_37940 [Leishmania donovani]